MRTLCQRIHNEESDTIRQQVSTPRVAARTANCVNAALAPSLTGTGDEGRDSYVEANVRYLQAEIECLIRHEVKTKGMVRL